MDSSFASSRNHSPSSDDCYCDCLLRSSLIRQRQQKRELVDAGTIADHEIKNDDLVYMCFEGEQPSADSLAGMPDQAPEGGGP